jgi:A/G-specific adenine glycosylase
MKRERQLTPARIRAFQETIKAYYARHGRDLPWRKTSDPYRILISEIMLQQTQVARVIDKYGRFIEAFPGIESLAQAPLREILRLWQGLGYNRRAFSVKKLAQEVVAEFAGAIPSDPTSLMRLPGIGSATAHAVCAFAFNRPVVFIETNIRTVFIHHFFENAHAVKDAEILPIVAETLDGDDPRTWYWALMDYGVMVKRNHVNPSRDSAHYKKQAPFKGSNRQIRGMILKALIKQPAIAEKVLLKEVQFPADVVKHNLEQLEHEGLVSRKGNLISVA